MNERVNDIVDRLRGIYILAVDDGAGLLNGSNRFIRYAKDHDPNWFQIPIQEEAAKEIEKLRNEIERLKDVIAEFQLKERIEKFNVECKKQGFKTK